MAWEKVWESVDEHQLPRGIERFALALDPGLEIDVRYDGSIFFRIEPDEVPIWVGILRAFQHGWEAGYGKCASNEYGDGSFHPEYPDDGLRLFDPVP
jgi:hypothetical protein